jgi:hypothetical protein
VSTADSSVSEFQSSSFRVGNPAIRSPIWTLLGSAKGKCVATDAINGGNSSSPRDSREVARWATTEGASRRGRRYAPNGSRFAAGNPLRGAGDTTTQFGAPCRGALTERCVELRSIMQKIVVGWSRVENRRSTADANQQTAKRAHSWLPEFSGPCELHSHAISNSTGGQCSFALFVKQHSSALLICTHTQLLARSHL